MDSPPSTLSHRDRLLESAFRANLTATALTLLPSLVVTTSVLRDVLSPWSVKGSTIATEWLACFLISSGCSWLAMGPSRHQRVLGWTMLSCFVSAYLLSWGLFYGSGHFFNFSALQMGAASFILLLKHSVEFNPLLTAAIPISGLALVALSFWLARLDEKHLLVVGARVRRFAWMPTVAAALIALVGAVTTALSPAIVQNQATGTLRTLPEHHRWVLRTKTGPLVHFALDTLAPLSGGSAWKLRALPLGTERPPQSAAKGYNERVPKDAPKYNVLVLLVESLRRDALRTFGGKRNVMPHVDALAQKSQVFLRAYAQATHSDYADVTSLSGHFPLRTRLHSTYPEDPPYPRVLLHDVLKPRGYRTAVISSQNEHWAGMLNFLSTPALDYVFHSESFDRTYLPTEDAAFVKWTETWKRSGKLDDRDTIDELIRWIGMKKSPFFTYVNLQNSHFPYRFEEGAPFQPSAIDFDYSFAGFPREKIEVVRNRYHNALRYIDDQIGRVLAALEESGRLKETLILISGDTGQAFYEHGFATHGKLPYEELAHVPLLVHAPGRPPQKHEVLLSQVDFTPTILDLLGMPPHPGHQGRSALSGEGPRVVFTGRQLPGFHELAIVQGRFKFMLLGDGKTLLFDLEADPSEKKNISEEHPALVQAFRHTALSFRKAQLDYYSDEKRMKTEYPPRLVVPDLKTLMR